MFLNNNGKMYYMYYVNAYYDVIDDYNFLEMALSSMLYIINDVILCST